VSVSVSVSVSEGGSDRAECDRGGNRVVGNRDNQIKYVRQVGNRRCVLKQIETYN